MIIHVCIGSACHLKGSYKVITGLQKMLDDMNLKDIVTIKGAFCLGQCTTAVSIKVDEGPILSVNEDTLNEFFEKHIKVAASCLGLTTLESDFGSQQSDFLGFEQHPLIEVERLEAFQNVVKEGLV